MLWPASDQSTPAGLKYYRDKPQQYTIFTINQKKQKVESFTEDRSYLQNKYLLYKSGSLLTKMYKNATIKM